MKGCSPIMWLISIAAFAFLLIALYVSLRRWFIEENFRLETAALEAFSTQQNAAREIQPDLPGSVRIYRCPPNTKYFIDKHGNSFCCSGTVRGLKCDGDVVCTMSPMKGGVESCASLEQKITAGIADRVCPPSMPNYFQNFTTGYTGCTESALTASRDAPTNESAPKCRIYKTDAENAVKTDSCANIREKELMKCISPNCTKVVQSLEAGKPAVIMQTYFAGESVPVPRMCSSKASYERYLTAKGQGIGGLAQNPAICEVAAALLAAGKPIDGTCAATV
jgi:hypothetical protein